ncbi:asparagine synthase [Glycocaulis alkaliphilus]|uniref:asparagine synthase (glutamine-hydrolyzing) n=1 Tax=Glycocaulis alkaliphilus TaxID=1434191 RepID=A0A3T0E6Q6_9PROT|nr:N-acetylglutaminylglutamine amidotransferase [Glycocaulis alkaliphilus]AZU02838.1 asparagine synthase [Glycocaulis alkaliphilus]GGB84927.1 asparagine synthetase B [Glycocaulis alkaliphilus]
MCGIAGELRFDGEPADISALEAVTGLMTPRGPDAGGLYVQGAAALGHRRLKIIDLTDAAQQPMVDSELGLSGVFNGCIYNHKELRAELEAKGYRFFSDGDTEVLLKGYHAWGEDFVQRLNGMFAFSIVERDSGRVLIGRDRLGIKPLYYNETKGAFRFASSLPALLAFGDIDTSLDPQALNFYFSFHAVVPAPWTILKGVRKLPPATLLRIEPDGTRSERRFWTLPFGPRDDEAGLSRGEWKERVADAMRLAVKRRLVADVPVGVLLSGGLDSSLIVGLLAEAGQTGLKTFSIGFESVGEEAGDEFQYSDIIAERFQTDHHQIRIDTARALPALERAIGAMSEPMTSHDCVGFFLLSEEVSKHVKVVQSGQGADEIFAGYHWYPPMLDANDAVGTYAKAFFDRDSAEMGELLHDGWADGDFARKFVAQHFAKGGAERPIDKALRIDTEIMLIDDPVKRVDNMTMAFGLEARVPFLDYEVVELAARVPAELKIADGGKGILKDVGRDVIPSEVIDRPKGYFPVPALKYLRGPYLERVRDAVTSDSFRSRGIVQDGYVDRLLADPEAHITPLRGSKLYQIGLLAMWLEAHNV